MAIYIPPRYPMPPQALYLPTAPIYVPPIPDDAHLNPTTLTITAGPGPLPSPGLLSPPDTSFDPFNPYPGFQTAAQIGLASEAAAAPYNSLLNYLRTQALPEMGSIIAGGQSGIESAYGGAADALKAIGPAIRTAYNQGAAQQGAFGSSYAGGLANALTQNANTINAELAKINAPAGQMVPTERAQQAQDVLNAVGGEIPAAMYAKQGGAYADAASFLPASAVAQGKYASARYMIDSQDKMIQIQQAMQQSIIDAFQAKIARGEQLTSQQISLFQDAQDRAYQQKRDEQDRILGLYNAGLISARDLGKALNVPNWQSLPGVPAALQTTQPKLNASVSKLLGYLADDYGNPILGKDKKPIPLPAAATTPDAIFRYDPQTGMTTAVDKTTGKVIWRTQTGTPQAAKTAAPKVIGSAASGYDILYQDAHGNWVTQQIKPPTPANPKAPRPVIHYDPATGISTAVDPATGRVVWTQKTGTPKQQAQARAAAGKPLSATVQRQANQILSTAKTGYYAAATSPGAALKSSELATLVGKFGADSDGNIGPYEKGGTYNRQLTLADLRHFKDADLAAIGLVHKAPNPTQSYYDLVQAGVPARRAFNMVGRLFPDWKKAHADWFPKANAAPSGGIGTAATQAVALAIKETGVPYKWGGEAPQTGFDCSGLIYWAYKQAGKTIPRTSQTQFRGGRTISSVTQSLPGDLFFYTGSDGTRTNPGHVALYIGNGKVVVAPRTGSYVQIVDWDAINGFVGIRRY